MNPAEKHAYYSALGIDTWVARRVLTGAPQGHLLLPLRAARPLAGNNSPAPKAPTDQPGNARRTDKQASRPSGRQILDELASDKVAAKNIGVKPGTARQRQPQSGSAIVDPSAASSGATKNSQRASSLQFELVCVVHEQLMLLDDITGLKLTPSAYNDWLKCIFFSLGLPNAALNVGNEARLAWPPAASLAKPVAQQSQRSAAAEMLHAWIQRKLAKQQRAQLPPHIVLMGPKPRELLLAKGSEAVAGDIVELPLFTGAKALLLPGSNEMWANPLGKREFWQQLQKIAIDAVAD